MQRARFWILCAMCALVAISGFLLFGARYWALSSESLKNMLPANVDMRLDNLTLTESGADDRSMIINAASAQYFKTEDVFKLEKVRAKIYSAQGEFDIEADAGQYQQGRRIIDLSGSVKVVDDSNMGVLTSDALTLKFEEGLLISQGPFCYTTPTMDLEGKSFVYQTVPKLLEIEGRAHVLF